MKNIITGFLAGVIVFVWVMFSWMVLPWHKATINSFENKDIVAETIVQGAPESGIYAFPGMEAAPEQIAKGPLLFVSVSHTGMNMGQCMLFGFFIQVVSGIIVTLLLSKAKLSTFNEKMTFIFEVSLFAAIIGILPNWNWWGFSLVFVLVSMIDLLIGWILAGILIAKRV